MMWNRIRGKQNLIMKLVDKDSREMLRAKMIIIATYSQRGVRMNNPQHRHGVPTKCKFLLILDVCIMILMA